MAFMGETTEVGVAELLSVLARRGHTGRLLISADGDDTQIYLEEGKIAVIFSSRRDLRLGRVLVRLGSVDAIHVDAALREQDRAGEDRALGQILVESGHADPEDLSRAAEEQCIESLARVIVAPHGSFIFHRDLRPVVRSGLLRLNAEGIVLEASRRADEMTRLRGLLPPPGVRLALAPRANAQTSPLGLAEALVVDALRRTPQTMAQLGEELPVEEVVLWRAIVRLRERGMIYAVADVPARGAEPPPPAAVGDERTIPDLLLLAAAGTTSTTRPAPTLDEIRAGERAGAATTQSLHALLTAVLDDRNQRRPLQALSHYSDDYVRRRGMMEASEIEALRHAGPPLPSVEQEMLVGIRDVRLLADGRASAIVLTRRAGALDTRAILIFAPFAGGWRIDDELQGD